MTTAARIAGVTALLVVVGMHGAITTGDWQRIIVALGSFHTEFAPLTKDVPASLTNETGETFAQYVSSFPRKPDPACRTICVQPIGMFGSNEWRAVGQTAEFLRRFYGLPVRTEPRILMSAIPADAWSTNALSRKKELNAETVLKRVLEPRVPVDAFMYLGITTSVLWQTSTNLFVAGQASMRTRVGLCSMAYNGRANGFMSNVFLLRSLKTAAHECGHMLSMDHCTAFECCMCSLAHGDGGVERPLEFCPECMAKLCWATNYSPRDRFQKLKSFCLSHGLADEAALYARYFVRVYHLGILE